MAAPRRTPTLETGPTDPVRLVWARDEGRVRHVSEYAHLAPDERPTVCCPVCREPVTLKLGDVNAHHAAHLPGSRCPVQAWETALHLNTKHHLAAALRAAAGGALTVRQVCSHRFGLLGETVFTPGLVPCGAVCDVSFVEGWDAVAVEYALSDTRPDIVLLRDGAPLAILEVRRTHAVTAQKLERFAALGVPWAEVVATRALYASLTAWTTDVPLTVLRTDACAQWWCDAHRPRDARRGRRVAEPDPAHRPWAARVVDRYLPNGRVTRDVVYVAGVVRGTRVHDAMLGHRSSAASLAALASGTTETVLRTAHHAFLRWARERRAAGERLDSPMSWAPASSLRDDDGRWVAGTTLYPQRFQFDRDTRRWAPRPGVGTRRWMLAERLDVAQVTRPRRRRAPTPCPRVSEPRDDLGRRRER